VGKPPPGREGADYVLERPPAEERSAIDAAIDKAIALLPQIFAGDLQGAMNKLHTDEKPAAKKEVAEKPAAKKEPSDTPPGKKTAGKPVAKEAPAKAATEKDSSRSEPASEPDKKEAGLLSGLFGRKK
jgi:hypothetical protein